MLLPIITGLSIGLLGSFHCIGMCGPIALSLPVHQLPSVQKHFNIFLYNFGRALTYATIGALFGFVGSSFKLFGVQQLLSILGGVLMIVLAGVYYLRPAWLSAGKWGRGLTSKLAQQLKKDKSHLTFLSIGLLNGFLPCGLVYMALTSAFATGGVWRGALLMFFFGLGTLPLMYVFTLSSQWISSATRKYLNKIIPFWIVALGILMILRGANLGIPYLSPSLNKVSNTVEDCCSTSDSTHQE